MRFLEEPPFLDEARVKLVDDLLGLFDRIGSERSGPVWVSLEAVSGWGKSRIVQELYKRLARERQSAGRYWPLRMDLSEAELAVATAASANGQILIRRKRVHPRMDREPSSLPSWFWWGISAGEENGVPSIALSRDLDQLEEHLPFLIARAKMLSSSWRERLEGPAAEVWGAAVEEARSELRSIALATAGLTVPGVGVVLSAFEHLYRHQAGVRALNRTIDAATVRDIPAVSPDIVTRTVETLCSIARPSLPLVVFVDDLHNVDQLLIAVLTGLLASSKPILLVTAGWPGVLDAPLLKNFAGRHESQILQITQKGFAPSGFPPGANLAELSNEAREDIIRHYQPGVTETTSRLISEKCINPLQIELVCALPWLRRRAEANGGILDLTPDEIDQLPRTLDAMFQEMWEDLPQHLQQASALAVSCAPAQICAEALIPDKRWDSETVQHAFALLSPSTTAEDIDAQLLERDWARRSIETLRECHDQTQETVAMHARARLFSEEEVTRGLRAGAAFVTSHQDAPHDGATSDIGFHRAAFLIALQQSGYDIEPRVVTAACFDAAKYLWGEPREAPRMLKIANLGVSVAEAQSAVPPELLELRLAQFVSLRESGRPDESIQGARSLVSDATEMLGPDHPFTLVTRRELAESLSDAGVLDEAILCLESLNEAFARVFGPEHQSTLDVRRRLARYLGLSGRVSQGVEQLRELLAEQSQSLGAEHETTFQTRASLALGLRLAGQMEEAIEAYQLLIMDSARVMGPDSPGTLAARGGLASSLGEVGNLTEAIQMLRTLLRDQTLALGPDHPETLTIRNNLATRLGQAGQWEQALTELQAVLEERARILGLRHPQTLMSRNNVATALRGLGRLGDAVRELQSLRTDQDAVLAPGHPEVLLTRNNLASVLGDAGYLDEAISQFRGLLEDRSRVLDSVHPDILVTRHNLGYWLGEAGRLDEAMDELHGVLNERMEVLGVNHPQTQLTRTVLAQVSAKWLLSSG